MVVGVGCGRTAERAEGAPRTSAEALAVRDLRAWPSAKESCKSVVPNRTLASELGHLHRGQIVWKLLHAGFAYPADASAETHGRFTDEPEMGITRQ